MARGFRTSDATKAKEYAESLSAEYGRIGADLQQVLKVILFAAGSMPLDSGAVRQRAQDIVAAGLQADKQQLLSHLGRLVEMFATRPDDAEEIRELKQDFQTRLQGLQERITGTIDLAGDIRKLKI